MESMGGAEKGSILPLAIVVLGSFAVIMLAWLAFANRQNHEIVNQEQEEQSFHVAEAGVHYALFLLVKNVCTPAELDSNEPVRRKVLNQSGEVMGIYDLKFENTPYDDGVRTKVTAVGYDFAKPNRCQGVEATLKSFFGALGTFYTIETWDQKTTVACGTPPEERVINCSGP
jgi:hypothetical protein